MIDLDKLEALARAATPGPWHLLFVESDDSAYPSDGCHVYADNKKPLITDDDAPGESDSIYIAAANPAAVLELIALARQADGAETVAIPLVSSEALLARTARQGGGDLPPLPPYPTPGRFTNWWTMAEEEVILAYARDAIAAQPVQQPAPVAMPAASVHDLETQQYIGARLRRVATAAGVTVDYGDDEFYYAGAFSILGDIARALDKTAASVQPVPTEWRELAAQCLKSMRQAVHFGKTGQGRPPQQTCLFEIDALEKMLAVPNSGRDAGQLIVSTGNDEINAFTVAVSVKQGSQTFVVYNKKHTANGDCVGVVELPPTFAAHPANVAQVGELSDEQIKEVIFDCHAEDGMGQELDLTKLCRAILAAAKKGGA